MYLYINVEIEKEAAAAAVVVAAEEVAAVAKSASLGSFLA